MTPHQQYSAMFLCVLMFLFFIDLLRRRKLREEYSILWLLTFSVMFLLVLQYDVLLYVTILIGAKAATTSLFLLSIVFLMFIAIQFSIKISTLTNQVKNLSQENALLRYDLKDLMAEINIQNKEASD